MSPNTLRERDAEAFGPSANKELGGIKFKNIVADIQTLIFDPNLSDSVFQVLFSDLIVEP